MGRRELSRIAGPARARRRLDRTRRAAGHVVLAVRHSMEFGGLLGIIDDLFVLPRFRRQRVGTALVAAAFDACQELGGVAMEVEVGTGNGAAQAVYGSFGLAANDDGRRRLAVRIDSREERN